MKMFLSLILLSSFFANAGSIIYKSKYIYVDERGTNYQIELALDPYTKTPSSVKKFQLILNNSVQTFNLENRSKILSKAQDFTLLKLKQDTNFPVSIYIKNCPDEKSATQYCMLNIGQDMMLSYDKEKLVNYLYLTEKTK